MYTKLTQFFRQQAASKAPKQEASTHLDSFSVVDEDVDDDVEDDEVAYNTKTSRNTSNNFMSTTSRS